MLNFYTPNELKTMGFASLGSSVIIKKTVVFYNPSKIHIGSRVIIDDFSIIAAKEKVVIGNNVHISSHCSLAGRYGITMEDYSGLSYGVCIYSESDDYTGISMTNPTIPEKFKPVYHQGPVILEKHAIIGTSTTILPNITIHEGVAVGAHSLVSRDCEAWSIYHGVPAKKLKPRKKDILEQTTKYELDFPIL